MGWGWRLYNISVVCMVTKVSVVLHVRACVRAIDCVRMHAGRQPSGARRDERHVEARQASRVG